MSGFMKTADEKRKTDQSLGIVYPVKIESVVFRTIIKLKG